MKRRHVASSQANACATLESLRIPRGADFHTLSGSQVDGLVDAAAEARYRKPRNANGSTARYFHDRLQRLARGASR